MMEVRKVSSVNTINTAFRGRYADKRSEVAFKAAPSGGASNQGKKFWFMLRRLSDQMKDITEIKNAFIAAIGTGIIAPAVILISPGKGDKEDKDKKFVQAIRQPISAFLALGAQVPATIIIEREINRFGYEKKSKFFRDDVIGDLVPTKKFLEKEVSSEEVKALETKFEEVINGKSLKQELENKIKQDYEEVGLKISDEELAKRVNKDKKDFLRKKIASEKFQKLNEKKIQDILDHPEQYKKLKNIQDIDLVTEDYQNLAKHRYKNEYAKFEKEAKLSFFDEIARSMGFETKRTKELTKKQDAFKLEKGLELLKKDRPEIFDDKVKRLRAYIEAYEKKAEKLFNNKKFWISLLVNLFMVTASCYALNWLHPRINKMIENSKAKKNAKDNQKVEVK